MLAAVFPLGDPSNRSLPRSVATTLILIITHKDLFRGLGYFKPTLFLLLLSTHNQNQLGFQSPIFLCCFYTNQGDKVQLSLDMTLVDQFPDLLVLSSTVLIRNFTIGSFASKYATLSYIQKRVVIGDNTLVTKIDDFSGTLHGFTFAHFNDITTSKFKPFETIDVIGFATRRERIHSYDRNGIEKQRVAVELMDPHGETIRCAFFGNCAMEVHQLFEMDGGPKPPVMIIQFAKANEYQGSLSLINAFHGTKLFYNVEMREMNDLRLRLRETGVHVPELVTVDPRPSRGDVTYLKGAFADCRFIRLDEFHPRLPIGCYGACATIDCLHFEKGWFYTSCRRCKKGVRAADENGSVSSTGSELVCGCETGRPVLFPRFKLDVTAFDDSSSASFTLFDQDIERLVWVTCTEVRQRSVSEFVYPEELNKLIGMRLLFKVEVSAFNIEKNHPVYTCKDVTDKPAVIRPFLEKKQHYHGIVGPC